MLDQRDGKRRAAIFRRGHYAAVSCTGHSIRVLLQALDDLGFKDNTAVVLFGDHGWQLGGHDMWHLEMTNFECGREPRSSFALPGWKNRSAG